MQCNTNLERLNEFVIVDLFAINEYGGFDRIFVRETSPPPGHASCVGPGVNETGRSHAHRVRRRRCEASFNQS